MSLGESTKTNNRQTLLTCSLCLEIPVCTHVYACVEAMRRPHVVFLGFHAASWEAGELRDPPASASQVLRLPLSIIVLYWYFPF